MYNLYKLQDLILSKFKSLGINKYYGEEIIELFDRVKFDKEQEIDDLNEPERE